MPDTNDTIWLFYDFHTQPRRYVVISRTEKQIKVKPAEYSVNRYPDLHTIRVRLADVGAQQWFWTERDAWAYRCKRLSEKIDDTKRSLQDLATKLDAAESELKTLEVVP
jgi:hypothetical protein